MLYLYNIKKAIKKKITNFFISSFLFSKTSNDFNEFNLLFTTTNLKQVGFVSFDFLSIQSYKSIQERKIKQFKYISMFQELALGLNDN